jgi:hypothetical protein
MAKQIRTKAELLEQFKKAEAWKQSGSTQSTARNETYEGGVADCIAWVLGETEHTPIQEDFKDEE